MYPAVCNMGFVKRVADRADVLNEAQSKCGMGRGNMIKRRRNLSIQGEESPKG